jgi:hypothetical protein
MVRYVRTGGDANVGLGTTGIAAGPTLPNYGLSIINVTTADVFVLQPPTAGCEKKILFTTSTSTGLVIVVRGSTAQTVTFSGGAMGDNTALPTMFKLAATRSTNMAVSVDLVGVSSVAWAITGVYPIMTTGIGGGSITLSTT